MKANTVTRFPYASKALELTRRAQSLQEHNPVLHEQEIVRCLEQAARLAEQFTKTIKGLSA